MATITGSTTIDWSTVSLDTSQFEDSLLQFEPRLEQVQNALAHNQYVVNSFTPTFLSATLTSPLAELVGGMVTLSGSGFGTPAPLINVLQYNNSNFGEAFRVTGAIDGGATDSITSIQISLPGVETNLSGSFLLNNSTGDVSGTATSATLEYGDTSVTFNGSFLVSGNSTIFDINGTVNQIHIVSDTSTINMTGLSISTAAFSAIDSIDDIFAVVGAHSPGNDTINYTNNSSVGMTFHGGPGNDMITVNGPNADTLFGDGGNDTLRGGRGADALNGGNGVDTASYADSTAGVTVDLLAGTGLGGQAQGDTLVAIENLIGSAFNDTLKGDAGPNVLNGRAGNDLLDGGAGNDSMSGEAGNDTYEVGAPGDVVSETVAGSAGGTDTVNATISYVLGANVEKLVLLGSALNGTGNALANEITGNDGANLLRGGLGADALDGAAGIDTASYASSTARVTVDLQAGTGLGGDAQGDTLVGIEKLIGSALRDTLTGDAGANRLDGGAGADQLIGRAGNDVYLVDNAGDRAIETTGGALGGIDRVESSVSFVLGGNVEKLTLLGTDNLDGTGNALANALIGNSGINHLLGGEGNDVLTGNAGDDTLDGGAGNDSMSGGAGNDSMSGGAGNDSMGGGVGNDSMSGGVGNDILTGGAGADTFVFNTAPNSATNVDHVTDFTSGTNVIQLENAVFTGLGLAIGALNPAAFVSGAGLTGGQDANDRIVYDTDTGHLYYDANGSVAGGATQIATLDGAPAVAAGDFQVI